MYIYVIGYDPDDADVRARTVYLVQIGYISMQVRESLATRMKRIPYYVTIYSGHAPSERCRSRTNVGRLRTRLAMPK